MRTLFTVVTLAGALAACGEEDPVQDSKDDDSQDQPSGQFDGGIKLPGNGNDASTPTADGSTPVNEPPAGDAGTPSSTQAAKFFLPTNEPTNTANPSVEVDAQGNAHMVYPRFVRGNAFYAFCAKDKCSSEDDMQVVEFETNGTTSNAMIALTKDGKPRILLNAYYGVYYGECDSNCGVRSSWSYQQILTHNADKEVTGEAFTLDNNGHPRFLIATYRALFGIGQKPAKTELAQCDANCTAEGSWSYGTIADPEIWYGSTLRYDATGRIHVATNLFDYKTENPSPNVAAYLTCSQNCNTVDGWKDSGVGFFAPYESTTEAVSQKPQVTLALTKSGQPRFAQVHKNKDGAKTVSYFSCDTQDCRKGDAWIYAWSFSGDNVDTGIDLALDAQDHPRIAHTVNYDIALSYCNDADCSTTSSKWNDTYVEQGGEIPADQIFLEWNCNVGAWFLHDPSLAIGPDGKPVIGYQARDISGGWKNPDPTKPNCVAGTDMTWSRLAVSTSAY